MMSEHDETEDAFQDIDVQFAEETLRNDAPDAETMVHWARRALQGESGFCTLRLVGIDEITALNRQFRELDKPTNVLSFEADLPLEVSEGYLGDVVICVPVVNNEALTQGKARDAHFAHMVVHGVLHLRGFDHIAYDEAEIMEQLEVQLLALEGIEDPYLESFGDSTSSHG
ncbi:MAG: rRNA maturation RNase YbeY [Granulosicoccaceae bacterium]